MRVPRLFSWLAPCAIALATWLAAPSVDAFCGFYVAGSDAELYNNATMVVMMRDGTRTVLSMQNNYEGPPADFAMVVPVPVVLQQDDVRTLPREIFDRVDQLAAPRLVEYWEQDPCTPQYEYEEMPPAPMDTDSVELSSRRSRPARDLGVTVEAQFAVGEYDIVILSAKDSGGLDTWLRQEKYKIPKGAEEVLRPYVASGMKFFVAKVNAKKVRFNEGQAMLSPLRFHYDSKNFSLPIRLGMLNANGPQDLIVHILARQVRYAVANYDNRAIPTNLDVSNETRDQFGRFYASLFDRVLEQHPRSVVTEYAWSAGSCDPCPVEVLSMEELSTLGADVIPTYERALRGRVPSNLQWQMPSEFVLTRLHARYDSSSLGEDLVFRAADAIAGGREFVNADGHVEQGVQDASTNNFQARYAIRHEWEGAVECEAPVFGVWGGPPPELQIATNPSSPSVARDLAFVERGASLDSFLTEPVAELASKGGEVLEHGSAVAPAPDPINPVRGGRSGRGKSGSSAGCAGCQGDSNPPLAGLGALLLIAGVRRRRR